MSWTWRDLQRDDSVWRFATNQPNSDAAFFQSGRHAAEEGFWKKIHENGSFRHRNASSMDNFYTLKDALRKEEGAEEQKRREGSVEENSRKSTEPGDSDTSSSSSDSDSDLEDVRDGELKQKKKKKQKKKLARKEEDQDEEGYTKKSKLRELERRQAEKIREIERRERELEERERQIDRRSREQTPDYSYSYYRSRRNSDVSNKDYPYSVAPSEYAPSIAPIQEENGRKTYETYSTRYY